ncbi:unnamed protein product [Eruca vesicaria subsp. sativa]|uniref:Uncharacterized protein n=1 Tax=Eruca vesicaria subsp. sativa TaxID=29727 RepID=A0ABC8LNQ5_ERUVS|nr:unnamed protein product [Eruca vesicaria subsp. sativa]
MNETVSFQAVQKLEDEEFQGIGHLRTSTLHKKIANARHDFFKLSGSEDKLFLFGSRKSTCCGMETLESWRPARRMLNVVKVTKLVGCQNE